MKLLRLDLVAYGPFTGHTLAFPANGPNFHIVYGPNEAGKSTTLRAITGLFYGIETQTGDAHRHPMSELRIGATLQHSSGQERAFLRKKGNRATLLDPKGAPVDESTLRAWLSIFERKHFEQMFGLSHVQLREAGEALADAKTDVGRMLFGASLDGTTLHQTLLRLDADAERLLTAGGNSGAITKALVAYREHLGRAKSLAVPARDWQAVQSELDAANAKQQGLSTEVVRVRTERHRRERLQRALPWVRQREVALRELAAMGEVQRLPPDIDAQRRDLVHALDDTHTQHARIENDLMRAKRERDELDVHEALLAAGARIKQLTEDLGKFKTELRDRPGVQKEIIAFRSEQRELLRQIGYSDVEPRAVGSVRVDEAALARVRKLEQDGLTRQTRLDDLRGRLSTKRALVLQHEVALAEVPLIADPSVLRATWEHLRPDKALSTAIRDAEGRLATLDTSVTAACAALVPWQGSPEAALALPVPSDELIRLFDANLADDERAQKDLAARITSHTKELHDVRRRLEALSATGEPPSVERLAEARTHRDLAWERVCSAWSEGFSSAAGDDRYAASVPLRAEYSAAVREADALADELRRESTRAAEYSAARREERTKATTLETLQREQQELNLRAQQHREAWQQAWRACDVEPLSPREMTAWRARHLALLECLRRRAEESTRLTALLRTMHEQRDALLHALAAAGAPVPDASPWLPLLLHVEHTLKTSEQQLAARSTLQRDLGAGQREVAELNAQIAECEQGRDAWRTMWGEAVARLRLSADALPVEANVVMNGLAEIFRLEEKCERQEVRLKAIDKQMAQFETNVSALVTEFAPALAGTTIERADALIELYAEATRNAERRRTLDEQVSHLDRDLGEARLARDTEQRRFDALLRDVDCADLGALDEAIVRWTQARDMEARRTEAEKRLTEVGEGWSLEALELAAKETDSDRVESEIAALDERLKVLDGEQREQIEAVGALGERLKKFSGADDAASVFGEAHQFLAQARAHAERYARLRLATSLLRRGIESYRQKNEGTILRRASRLFECLTLGRYQQLRVEYDGDKARLTCLRGHELVDVKNALSDGTLDQLYLSLRLASLEQHLDAQEPMPLVLDDIFIHFDDDRARAGLEVLAEIAQKTQVLLLTHHARNLELARNALKPGTWSEHRLSSSASSPPSATT